MRRHFIVDGYNLIYHFPELRKRMERDLEEARNILISRLASLSDEKNIDLTVVFDGDEKGNVENSKNRRIGVIFSKYPEKADPFIKRFIDEKMGKEDIVVVTSDHEIVNYGRLSGVRVISSKSLAHEMLHPKISETEKKYDFPMSKKELEEWLRLFKGDRDEDRQMN